MKILSLFDGISCARVALERAGIRVEAYYASEVDKYAMQISAKNYPDIVQLGSVTEVRVRSCEHESLHSACIEPHIAKDIDLLIGGSPCQDLSIAKKDRKGLDGERSGLFWEYVRILHEVKPKYFILENVNSMPKEAKAIITEALGVEPIMINAALVSAQNRKRLFWVGKLVGDKYEQVQIQQPDDRGILLKDILEDGSCDRLKSYCIDANYAKGASWKQYIEKGRRQLVIQKDGSEKLKSNTIRTSGRGSGIDDKHNWDTIRIGQIGKGGQADRIYSPERKSTTLSALGGGRGAKTGLYMIDTRQMTREGKPRIYDKGKSPTLNSTMYKEPYSVTDNTQIRKLTPTECERLQGLEDNFTDGVSNSQRYKMLGNAFNVDVVSHILLSFILDKPDEQEKL